MVPLCNLLKISAGLGLFLLLAGCGVPYMMAGPVPPTAFDYDALDQENYKPIQENSFLSTLAHPVSTFSIDVDTAAYSNVRRFIESGRLPHPDAVRIEELVNYFTYDYPEPAGEHPFSLSVETARCPWNEAHRLVRIGLKGRSVDTDALPPANLVFLIDVSGSMSGRLPLVKSALKLLVEQLRAQDRIAIVAYAGAAGLVLPATPGNRGGAIRSAIERLEAGGSTAGGAGIELAYRTALQNYLPEGNNRVILATDGDFNVGPSSESALHALIEEKRRSGVFLTVLGFGTGNLNDAGMELLADKGNGNYAYIDSQLEAKKVLVDEMGGTLLTIAKDVKIQVQFNPAKVREYRLIGYENRLLQREDFADDSKDAGEIGAGHTVTALYEIVPAQEQAAVDSLAYVETRVKQEARDSSALSTVELRYKPPHGSRSILVSREVEDADKPISQASPDLRFASAVAEFGLLLRDSRFKANADYAALRRRARAAVGADSHGYRNEFVELVEKTRALSE